MSSDETIRQLNGVPGSGAVAVALPQTEADQPAAAIELTEIDALVAEIDVVIAAQRLPVATYRVQLNRQFKFSQAQQLADYWAQLGISHVYASPFLQAREGSLSGYDVVDYSAINDEIGTRDELESLSRTLRERQLGLILDVVPNHMGTASVRNRWWMDVLENGPSSRYADYFDIDWAPLKPDLANRVLLPVLGDQFGRVLEDGQLAVRYDEGVFSLHFYDLRFPIAPATYTFVLEPCNEPLTARLGAEHDDVVEFLSIQTAIRNLPPRTATSRTQILEKHREQEVVKRRLKELTARSSEVLRAIDESLQSINGTRGNAASFDRLDALLREQPYRLAFWRVAADEINYRRFFDINELAAIRVENREVFENTHSLVFELLERGIIQGLRIDHPDGLFDPRGYLVDLQEQRFLQLGRRAFDSRSGQSHVDWPAVEAALRAVFRRASADPAAPRARPLFVVVEKILSPGERLPHEWPVHGTVGYALVNALSGLFVAGENEPAMSATYARFTGDTLDFRELAYQCKRLIVRTSMASELSVLGDRLDRLSERNRWTQDFTRASLTRALQEVIAAFSVYRSYVKEGHVGEGDRRFIESAVARAKRRNPAISASIFDYVREILLLRYRDNADEEERQAQQSFAGKFQQLTGPIMAKAVEDTAFYRFNRLVSLNEVGGDPERFGTDLAGFHEVNRRKLPEHAHGLSSSSTHDTKRSEDVRVRINVLSEIPSQWRKSVQRWARGHKRIKATIDGMPAPAANDEYVLYQTLIGVWPDAIPRGDERRRLIERLQQYMLKVAREAKVHTSWVSPHEAYEQALTQFVAELFREDKRRTFLAELDSLAQQVSEHGRWNALSQQVLKIASPGAPDFYQGTELWCLTLVDPDNRQPVDFELRQRWFAELQQRVLAGEREQLLSELLERRRDGRIKLFTTWQALQARRESPDLFTSGEYIPLEARGKHAERVVALARRRNGQVAIAVVPRLTVKLCSLGGPPPLGSIWEDTSIVLPPELAGVEVADCFTTRQFQCAELSLPVAQVLERFPVALLNTSRS